MGIGGMYTRVVRYAGNMELYRRVVHVAGNMELIKMDGIRLLSITMCQSQTCGFVFAGKHGALRAILGDCSLQLGSCVVRCGP